MKWQMPAWLHGGVRGIAVFVLLLLFYLSLYSWLLDVVYPDGMVPNYALYLMFLTGHGFLILLHFNPFPDWFWTVIGCEENISGFGTISSWCSEGALTLVILLALLGIYFTVGAVIAHYWAKRSKLLK